MQHRAAWPGRAWILAGILLLVGGGRSLLHHGGDAADQPAPPTEARATAVPTCVTSTAAIVEFAVVNARGTIPDPKGGPPAFVVGHQLALHVVVAPVVGMVRLSTSSGPLSPAADIVSVDVYPDALGVADVVLSVPGRPDRVFADAYLRDDLERACRARDPWLVVERMLRLQMGP